MINTVIGDENVISTILNTMEMLEQTLGHIRTGQDKESRCI